jgi:hypothetical protein
MTWTQNYDPFGFWPLSTIVAALPVLTLFFVLVALKKRVWVSAMWGMLVAVAAGAARLSNAGGDGGRGGGARRDLRDFCESRGSSSPRCFSTTSRLRPGSSR